jgi:dephospho-CoA kinase
MLIVGLTGGIGAGKSTVDRHLAERGAQVIDVDAIGRDVLRPHGGAEAQVAAEFGTAILAADGSIDRTALAGVVFADSESLSRLTAISHPAINEELVSRLRRLASRSVIVLDMAVLTESDLGRTDERYRYTFVVTVEAPASVREERAVASGFDREDVRRRMERQASDSERRALADAVIVNDGTIESLIEQVDVLWARLEVLAEPNRHASPGPSRLADPAG